MTGPKHPKDMSAGQTPATEAAEQPQLLHLVFGGELEDPTVVRFRDLDKLDIVGIFPDYASALKAWRAKAQQTVDNAHMRYFIVHLHRLMDPDNEPPKTKTR
jgi:Domain of unknown function (DUF4170)